MTTDDDNIETPLPVSYDVPDFEGLKPTGVVTKVNGSGERIQRPMHHGERGVLVLEYECTNVAFPKVAGGIKRAHTLTVLDLYELPGKPGKGLLRSLRQAHELSSARTGGKVPALAGIAESVDPNAAGVAIEVDDEGRIHTSSVDGILPHVDVAVLVFEDESRALWPDDFADAAGPHPEAGERLRKPAAKAKEEPVLIRRVLDADTGETLEEWTEEQENERLRELEESLAREEARQDVESAEQLLAARDAAQAAAASGEEDGPNSWSDPRDEAHPLFRARALLTDTSTGTTRAIGSVKAELPEVDDVAVIEAALELERAGKNRAGMLEILEARAAELAGS